MEPLLSVTEVAAVLGVSRGWVYDQVRMGAIPAGRYGKHLRFRRSDVSAYIDGAFR